MVVTAMKVAVVWDIIRTM